MTINKTFFATKPFFRFRSMSFENNIQEQKIYQKEKTEEFAFLKLPFLYLQVTGWTSVLLFGALSAFQLFPLLLLPPADVLEGDDAAVGTTAVILKTSRLRLLEM